MSTNNTKQAAWVAFGSFCSYVVGIVSPMILSRYFDKADYGTYKQVMYVYNTLLAVFALGLPRAFSYFIPKRPIEQARGIISKLNIIFVILGLLFSATLYVFAPPIARLLKNENLVLALRVFSPVPALLLPTLGLEGIFASFKKTEYLAVYSVTTRCFTVLCTVIPVVLFSGSYIDAIIGFDIAAFLTCALAYFLMKKPLKGVPSVKTDITYKQVFSFSIPLLVASLWGMIISSTPQFFISRYYGSEVFADFSNGFMEIPFVGMVISAIATVLLPAFARMDQGDGMNNDVYSLWMSSMKKSAKVVFPMLVFCIFFAKLIMICLYGDIYDSSAVYFQVKTISGLFFIIPFAPILIAIGKTKVYATLHFITAILIVVFDYLVVRIFDSPILVAVASEFSRIIYLILMMGTIAKYARKSIYALLPLKDLSVILLATALAGVPSMFFCRLFAVDKFVLLGVGLLSFVILYYAVCWFLKISYKEFASSLFPSRINNSLIRFIP